jgi:hypothetical protein
MWQANFLGHAWQEYFKTFLTSASRRTRRIRAADANVMSRGQKLQMRINKIRLLIATILSFVFSIFYNGLVHLVILSKANKQVESLRRVDCSSKAWIALLATLVTSFIFTAIYTLFVSKKSAKKGLYFGFCFGLFIAIMVDINQYVLYPLPFSLVARWALFGIIELSLIGMIVGSIVKDNT